MSSRLTSARATRASRQQRGTISRWFAKSCIPRPILTWGLSDRYTWVPTWFKRPDGLPNRPLPLDADLKPKPLFDVIEGFTRKFA